ncbi:MAG: hypothetical protein HQ523_04480 [Lentisphaerae bacterium]|nr:hypothetical protein [Lentisphaerota bacterium]
MSAMNGIVGCRHVDVIVHMLAAGTGDAFTTDDPRKQELSVERVAQAAVPASQTNAPLHGFEQGAFLALGDLATRPALDNQLE